MVRRASGSNTTTSPSEPRASAPFRGYIPPMRAGPEASTSTMRVIVRRVRARAHGGRRRVAGAGRGAAGGRARVGGRAARQGAPRARAARVRAGARVCRRVRVLGLGEMTGRALAELRFGVFLDRDH